jgi:hypothetical protein
MRRGVSAPKLSTLHRGVSLHAAGQQHAVVGWKAGDASVTHRRVRAQNAVAALPLATGCRPIKHVPYLPREAFWREGLLQEREARVEDTVVDDGLVRVP